ncbi:hypothetical protein ACH4U7_50375 [Streptomyces sp. NPDC020845]|uniref:hypothetical protein n=1 Tax=Streptomyces sp. NPDC020845 TaxID=3365096 RepID=UPI0037AA209B
MLFVEEPNLHIQAGDVEENSIRRLYRARETRVVDEEGKADPRLGPERLGAVRPLPHGLCLRDVLCLRGFSPVRS